MIKERHYSTTDRYYFSPIKYLQDHHPNEILHNYSHGYSAIKEIKVTDFIEALKPVGNFRILNYYYLTNEDNSCLINLSATDSDIYQRADKLSKFDITYVDKFDIFKFVDDILPSLKNPSEDKKYEIRFIVGGGMEGPKIFVKKSKKTVTLDKENAYNLGVPVDTLLEDLKSDKSGLILFHSKPGAGKSTLIKYFAQELPSKYFFYIDSNNIGVLSNINFTEFCYRNLENAILIVEDCESILTDRKLSHSEGISTILNLTDGIIGELLNLKIIATLNTTDAIDPALLRKGRLIRKVEFKALEKEQVGNLAKSLNKNVEIKECMLCDVYNTEDNGTDTPKRAIGF